MWRRVLFGAGVCVAAGLFWQIGLAADEPATAPAGTVVKLTLDTGADLQTIFSPRRVQPGVNTFNITGDKGSVSIDGEPVQVAGSYSGGTMQFGADAGEGAIDPRKMAKMTPPNLTAAFHIKRAGKPECVVLFSDLRFGLKASKTSEPALASIMGRYAAACAMKGSINGNVVRIIDDNLDGKITQDGADAILIGSSLCAVPLGKVHQIGKEFCELTVAADGASLTFTKRTDLKGAPVDAAMMKMAGLKGAVLTDAADGQSFDLTQSKALPPGQYKLDYAILGTGKDSLTVLPPAGKATAYAIQGDSTNALRLGPTVKVDFNATLKDGNLLVQPNLSIVGAGGEVYKVNFRDLPGPPVVTVSDGSRTLGKGNMEFG